MLDFESSSKVLDLFIADVHVGIVAEGGSVRTTCVVDTAARVLPRQHTRRAPMDFDASAKGGLTGVGFCASQRTDPTRGNRRADPIPPKRRTLVRGCLGTPV
jgi:hypothetical protein